MHFWHWYVSYPRYIGLTNASPPALSRIGPSLARFAETTIDDRENFGRHYSQNLICIPTFTPKPESKLYSHSLSRPCNVLTGTQPLSYKQAQEHGPFSDRASCSKPQTRNHDPTTYALHSPRNAFPAILRAPARWLWKSSIPWPRGHSDCDRQW